MKPLTVKGTEMSPQIIFDPEMMKFSISGESRPEDAHKFYDPLLKWIDEFLTFTKKNGANNRHLPIRFEFNFIYFNTSSARYILDILCMLDSHHSEGAEILVLWHYRQKDEDIRESGEEFAKLVDIPFEYVPA